MARPRRGKYAKMLERIVYNYKENGKEKTERLLIECFEEIKKKTKGRCYLIIGLCLGRLLEYADKEKHDFIWSVADKWDKRIREAHENWRKAWRKGLKEWTEK